MSHFILTRAETDGTYNYYVAIYHLWEAAVYKVHNTLVTHRTRAIGLNAACQEPFHGWLVLSGSA